MLLLMKFKIMLLLWFIFQRPQSNIMLVNLNLDLFFQIYFCKALLINDNITIKVFQLLTCTNVETASWFIKKINYNTLTFIFGTWSIFWPQPVFFLSVSSLTSHCKISSFLRKNVQLMFSSEYFANMSNLKTTMVWPAGLGFLFPCPFSID